MQPQKPVRAVSAILCVLVCAFIFASCNPKTGGGSGGGKHKLAFVTNNASDFWTIARKGTEKAAKEIPDIDVEFRITSDGTAAEQQRVVDDLLAKGVNGIAISPVDPANQSPMLNRAASQALVVTQDSDAPTSNRTCYIGTDNVEAGRQAGRRAGSGRNGFHAQVSLRLFFGARGAENAGQPVVTFVAGVFEYSLSLVLGQVHRKRPRPCPRRRVVEGH